MPGGHRDRPNPPPDRHLRSQDPAGESRSRDKVAYPHYPLLECVLLVMRLLHDFERNLELDSLDFTLDRLL